MNRTRAIAIGAAAAVLALLTALAVGEAAADQVPDPNRVGTTVEESGPRPPHDSPNCPGCT